MLQKLLVVIIGLVMSVVGALAPDGLVASKNAGQSPDVSAGTAEEMLATLRTSDGRAFARVSVLWVEVDGRRVTEDAWGTGEVEELRFKVGVKDVEDVALAVGDKVVPLHPTDIITVRLFRGDFSYRGLGSPLATLQLQGTVKTTVLNEGGIANRVQTSVNDLDLGGVRQSRPGDESRVAYVILTTGEKVDTVAIEDGGGRLFTEEATRASEAKDEPGNLLAKWVKIDGKVVREYTWGDGQIRKLEFEPAEAASRSVVLRFNGETSEVLAGERVVIEDFVGEYLVYQVSGGLTRVRLDGYAGVYTTAAALKIPQEGGAGAPLADFTFTPASPKSADTVSFRDESEDEGGIIVLYDWDFGDGSFSKLQHPTHRFAKAGSYDVRLRVMDNDLQSSEVTQTIVVRNTEPVADFDFSPKVVTTDTVVAFTDASFDSDGSIVNWTWNFGDGNTSHQRHPSYRFRSGGNATVTLTTVDDAGARTSLSKIVAVRNAPPVAAFTFAPAEPATLVPVQFFDNSSDRDGVLVSWNWSFGDGSFGAGSAPVHAYARPGLYTVTLRATDNSGDSDTISTNILVKNRAPFADFTWSPEGQPAGTPVLFTSTSSDPDGAILLHAWDFGDGSRDTTGPIVSHRFPRAGTYDVTLTVTDNALGRSNITKSVSIGNSAPRADFRVAPNPTFRGQSIVFSDASTDPDQDPIVNWTWDMGDGATLYGRLVNHAYTTLGTKAVTLHVLDSQGSTASVTRFVNILNRPPTLAAAFSPRIPVAGEDILFTAEAVDPDLPGGTVSVHWSFNDGARLLGPSVTRNFTRAGNYSVSVVARDTEGGVSAPYVMGIRVDHALPRVNFTWTPTVPLKDELIQFRDLSIAPPDAPIRSWAWNFGVGTTGSTSSVPNPTFAYRQNGNFTVTLTVTDAFNQTNVSRQDIRINLAPSARFLVPAGDIALNQSIQFEDLSVDEDGTIANYTWQMGDGTVQYVRHAFHPGYSSPGQYLVNLTVRDDLGATSSTTKAIDIANHPPVAKWSFTTTGPQERGVDFHFDGGESSDPDNQQILSYSWDWGDSTPRSSGQHASHVFTRSGDRVVGLTVRDPFRESLPVPGESHKSIRIGANHSVTINVTAELPDGSEADLSLADYTVSARIGSTAIVPGAISIVGRAVEVVVAKELWVHGTSVTVRVDSRFLVARAEGPVVLNDDVHNRSIRLRLQLGSNVTIAPFGGLNPPLLPLLPAEDDYGGDPLYGSVQERPRGTGLLRYTDGSVVNGGTVAIQARYVPLRVLQGVRDAMASPNNNNTAALGFCNVASATTLSNGTFTWAFDGTTLCYTNSVNGGLYPVGRWEVRAVATPPGALASTSPIRAFYVDPTGGALLQALSGLA